MGSGIRYASEVQLINFDDDFDRTEADISLDGKC